MVLNLNYKSHHKSRISFLFKNKKQEKPTSFRSRLLKSPRYNDLPRNNEHPRAQIVVSKYHFRQKGIRAFYEMADFRSGPENV